MDIELLSYEGPHSYVKLSSLVKEGPLNVLLHDPVGHPRPSAHKANDVVQIVKYLYSPTLVASSRLYQPDIVSTVLNGQSLFRSVALEDVFVALVELLCLPIVHRLWN